MGLLGLTNSQNYSDIADAIRAKTGTTSTYAPDEMALAIRSISGGGAVILQDKTATPSTAMQTVQYDAGYDGLRKVTIGAIPNDYIIPSGTKQISSNGIVDVAAYKSANVQVSGGGGANLYDATLSNHSEQDTIHLPGRGYDGFSSVIVQGVPSTFVGSNIPRRGSSDVSVDGGDITVLAGYYSSAVGKIVKAGKAITPATTIGATPAISVNSSTGVINVSVSATSNVTPTVTVGYVTSGTSGTITVSGSNSSALNTQAAATITPNTADQTIAANQFLTGAQTIKGDANLVAGNIKKNTQIFGVTGTYEGSGGGGVTNVITGTFTTNSAAGVQSVSLPYTGTGHIIAAHVFVEGGAYNSGNSWYNSKNRYTVAQWMMSKAVTTLSPTFATSGSANYGCTAWVFKNSTSAPTSYSRSSAMTTNTFSSSTATSAGATCVRFSSNKNMRCYVSATSTYGLLANTTYHYIVTYSS